MSSKVVYILNSMKTQREHVRTSLAARMQYIRSVSIDEMKIMTRMHCESNYISVTDDIIDDVARFTVDKHMFSLGSLLSTDDDISDKVE